MKGTNLPMSRRSLTVPNREIIIIFFNNSFIYEIFSNPLKGFSLSFVIVSRMSLIKKGPPILNSPSEYVLLIFSIASGYFVFSEIPDFMSLIGIGLIATSGLLILFREQIRRQPLAVNTNFRN